MSNDKPLADLIGVLNAATVDKYSPFFNVLHTTYTSALSGLNIKADILVSKSFDDTASHGTRPLLIRIHGGYLVDLVILLLIILLIVLRLRAQVSIRHGSQPGS